MGTRIELGRIAGIAIYLDMFFVLILVVSSASYFTSGNTQVMSAGLVIIAGIFISILLHELGHAMVARIFKTQVTHIDLTGLGGIAHFGSSLPKSAFARVCIYLAGPAVNVALVYLCEKLGILAGTSGKPLVAMVMLRLAGINYFLALFNLLPALPLDGGHALEAILGRVFGGIWGQRIVSALGIIVAALVAVYAVMSLPWGLFMLLIAFFLFETNIASFRQVGGFGGRR